jgi:hypothetical protein
MPLRKRPHTESPANSAVDDSAAPPVGSRESMEKFNELARKLVNVPRDELREKQHTYDAANASRRAERKGRA